MYLFSASQGHGTSSSPSAERSADRVDAGNELAVGAEHVEGALAHAGHDPHRDRDVGGVGELDADVGDRRAERAHRERDHVHRAAAHRAAEEVGHRLAHLGRVAPVVGGAGVGLALGADEGPVLDPRDVAGVGEGRGRSSGASRRRAARRCRRRRGPGQAGRTPRRVPSHQCTAAGSVSSAISRTQEISFSLSVRSVSMAAAAVMLLTGCLGLLSRAGSDPPRYRPAILRGGA